MKRRFLILTAGMMVGAVLFLLSICSAGFLNAKPLLISLAGLLLMWGGTGSFKDPAPFNNARGH